MSQSSQEVVRSMYDAFARADIDTILSTVDEQIDWRAPASIPHGGHFSGREGVERFFRGIGEHWESLAVEVEDVLGDGDRVVVLVSAHGRLRPTGEESGYWAAHAWTLRGGAPIRFHEAVDAPAALPAAVAST